MNSTHNTERDIRRHQRAVYLAIELADRLNVSPAQLAQEIELALIKEAETERAEIIAQIERIKDTFQYHEKPDQFNQIKISTARAAVGIVLKELRKTT